MAENDLLSSSKRTLIIPRDFGSELRTMMYGFGDEDNPRADCVALMEELVIEYIVGLASKALDVAHMQRRERPDVTDVKFIIRKNRRQLNRVRYLLEMKAVITKATKMDPESVAQTET